MSTGSSRLSHRGLEVLMVVIMGLAVLGYVVGINDGVPREDFEPSVYAIDANAAHPERLPDTSDVIPAAGYSEMRRTEFGSASMSTPSLQRAHEGAEFERCISCHNPHTAAVQPDEQAKLESLSIRASRRAFNGAPPVIPHAVEGTNDAACYACHGEGALVGQRVANRMSHGWLSNCLQCHAAPPPQPFAELVASPSNSFVGLPTPTSGPRAFPGAPPVIPHSTWMRDQCLSCHGGVVGWPGLEVTHRWRSNCLQCHGTSAALEQQAVAASGGPAATFATH